MSISVKKLLLALVWCCAASPIYALGLNEQESLRIGLARGELSELSRAQVDEARVAQQEAGLWSNPTLELERDRTESRWQVSQAFDISGKRALKQQAAAQGVLTTEAEIARFRLERTAEIRRAFFQYLHQQGQLSVLDTQLKRIEETERVLSKLRTGGEASGYDLRRLIRERQLAVAQRAEKQAELLRSRAQLAALLGNDLTAYQQADGLLLPPTPSALENLLAKLDQHPSLTTLSTQAAAADLSEQAATRGWIPDVTLGLGMKRNDAEAKQQTTLSASIPLPVFDRQQTGQQRARAQATTARAHYRLARSQAEGQLRGAYQQLSQLLTTAQQYRREAVHPSSELLRIAETSYRAGESSMLELLDAYRGAFDAEITALDLEWKARLTSIELEQLAGGI